MTAEAEAGATRKRAKKSRDLQDSMKASRRRPTEEETVPYWACAVRENIHATIDAIAEDKTRDEIVRRLIAALSSLERLDSFAAKGGTP